MRKIILLALLAAFSFASCHFVNGKRVRGSGNSTTQERQASNFTAISSSGSYDIYLVQGTGYNVRVEADDNLMPYIETIVQGNVLEVRTKKGFWISTNNDIKVYVTAPSFSKVESSGSGDIFSEGKLNNTSPIEMEMSGSGNIKVDVNAPEVKADLRGSGNINVSGETRIFSSSILGSGDIRAADLKAENVDVDIAGSGNAEVFASVKLTVDVKGSGDVKYKGGAQVSSDIAGSGSVKKVD
ncbi:MAG: head GIN domain-containing protein [Chitinophagaceae bacterium]